MKLEVSGSGSYTNASQGIFWTLGTSAAPPADTTPPTGTPAGKSTITVTAAHGTITEPLQLTLIVK